MPIVTIEVVGGAGVCADDTASMLAQGIADALGSAPGSVWVRIDHVPASRYAENGPAADPPPVFVRVLVRIDDPTALAARAGAIAAAVAAVIGRPRERVHVVFEPDARGRVFFGGAPDPR